jgi:hypothetical protein
MDEKEKERRRREKAKRLPISDTTLIVQNGQIDTTDIFLHINKKLEERNG